MFFKIFIKSKMNLDLFNSIHSLIKNMFNFINLPKSSFTKQFFLNKKSIIPILLQILIVLILICNFFIPENELLLLLHIFPTRHMFLDPNKLYSLNILVSNLSHQWSTYTFTGRDIFSHHFAYWFLYWFTTYYSISLKKLWLLYRIYDFWLLTLGIQIMA